MKGKLGKLVHTSGNENIAITCLGCGGKVKDWKHIYEGYATSYKCPKCGYEGFAYERNTKIMEKSGRERT
jgi:predicted nucleic-acid-binding Zn-ribbon protein